jgi:hypothetical protein
VIRPRTPKNIRAGGIDSSSSARLGIIGAVFHERRRRRIRVGKTAVRKPARGGHSGAGVVTAMRAVSNSRPSKQWSRK